MAKSIAVFGERPRQIVHWTRGQRHGPITRLMSPSDLGQSLKPFVFLDLFDTEGTSFSGMGLHPHSGIATLWAPIGVLTIEVAVTGVGNSWCRFTSKLFHRSNLLRLRYV
jgi:hypothetical protein